MCALANELAQGRYTATRWRGGQLTIVASSPTAAHLLAYEREQLAAVLKQRLGWPPSRTLKIRIRVQP